MKKDHKVVLSQLRQSIKPLFGAFLLSLSVFMICILAYPAIAANSAVIFMYHRFGEGDYPSTNISLEQFEAHIAELQNGNYWVMPLPQILDALKNGDELPDRTVAITIDDAYLSVFKHAWPRLRDAGFPFSLFVATDPVDNGHPNYMTWDQIRQLANGGVTIGSQTASHLHMAASGRKANRRDLEKSNARFVSELGKQPDIIAYPYGEAGLDVFSLVREMGFRYGLGQHSGVAGSEKNFFYLPRFALNERYGDDSRFRMAANALALPVEDVSPPDPVIRPGDDNPPAFAFTLDQDENDIIKRVQQLSCFSSHEGKADLKRTDNGDKGIRIELHINNPLPKGRTRINCTQPVDGKRWRWFGRQIYVVR